MIIIGIRKKSMSRDKDGHRDYKIVFRVKGSVTDGPANALSCPGLPVVGSPWNFFGDFDPWATCRQEANVTPVVSEENNTQWDVELTFSTRGDDRRCKDQQFDDPLLTPPRIAGGGKSHNVEATNDRFGKKIVNSAWEQLRGQQVEFDDNRDTVKIQMNVASFATVILAQSMKNKVNAFPLWGFARRCVKLSNAPWEAKYYGFCYKYYSLDMEFDTNTATFDRDVLDEGTKVLKGHWDNTTDRWIVDQIGGLNTPKKPSVNLSTTGGTIPAGTYAWRVAARNDLGTTLASDETIKTTTGATSKATLTWPKIAGATNYDVYWGASGATLLIANVTENTYVDTGAAHPGAGNPPTTNTTGGVPPDFKNPAHFIRFKDRHGENARVVLNGAGLPATAVSNENAYYVSLVNVNTGFALTDTAHWIVVVGPINPFRWDNTTAFVPGNLVHTGAGGAVYVCILANTNKDPDLAANNGPAPTKPWLRLFIGDAPTWRSTRNKGTYDITTTYASGEYVIGSNNAGSIHIEYYDEADFSLLGIPLIL